MSVAKGTTIFGTMDIGQCIIFDPDFGFATRILTINQSSTSVSSNDSSISYWFQRRPNNIKSLIPNLKMAWNLLHIRFRYPKLLVNDYNIKYKQFEKEKSTLRLILRYIYTYFKQINR